MSEPCKHCGAKAKNLHGLFGVLDGVDFECGATWAWKCGKLVSTRSLQCCENQIATLQARVTQLESKCHQQQVEIAALRTELERATAGLQ